MNILDGKAVSEKILSDLKNKIEEQRQSNHLGYTIAKPETYVKAKIKVKVIR
jgi:hypothetical protein